MRFSYLIAFDAYTVKWYIRRTSDFISYDALITVEIMPYCGQKVKMQIPLRPCWFLCERFYEQPCTRGHDSAHLGVIQISTLGFITHSLFYDITLYQTMQSILRIEEK